VGRQVVDGAVLVVTGDRSVAAAPVVPALAAVTPDAYRKALLPPVAEQPGGRRLTDGLTDGEVRARLTDPAIAAAYLGLPAPGARRLLGDPVGPATTMPDGRVRQAVAGGGLEHPPGPRWGGVGSLGPPAPAARGGRPPPLSRRA